MEVPPEYANHPLRMLMEQKKPQGRLVTAFTMEKQRKFLYYIQENLPLALAAGKARISASTIINILAQGQRDLLLHEQHDVPLTEVAIFRQSYDLAYATGKQNYIERMRGYGERNPMAWAGEATALERLDPETYGQKPVITLNENRTVRVIFEEASDKDWQDGVDAANEQRQITDGYDDSEIVDTALVEGADDE